MRKGFDFEDRITLNSFIGIAYLLLLLHFYKTGYSIVHSFNIHILLVDAFIVHLDKTFHYQLLTPSLHLKLFVFFLIVIREALFSHYRTRRDNKNTIRKWLCLSFLGTVLFWDSGAFLRLISINEAYSFMLYLSLTTIGMLLIKRSLGILLPLPGSIDDLDQNPPSNWKYDSINPKPPKPSIGK